MNLFETSIGVAAVLFAGGASWWARYVTSGASKATQLIIRVEEMKSSLEEHEKREAKQFSEIAYEERRLRGEVVKLSGSVERLHGKMDALTFFVRNGEKGNL